MARRSACWGWLTSTARAASRRTMRRPSAGCPAPPTRSKTPMRCIFWACASGVQTAGRRVLLRLRDGSSGRRKRATLRRSAVWAPLISREIRVANSVWIWRPCGSAAPQKMACRRRHATSEHCTRRASAVCHWISHRPNAGTAPLRNRATPTPSIIWRSCTPRASVVSSRTSNRRGFGARRPRSRARRKRPQCFGLCRQTPTRRLKRRRVRKHSPRRNATPPCQL
mmetsp:Transcript_106971/g.300868  ORF Transcript_106971/g.300868 Transcript_106971/m.300868 type:complete len:225 (+) Transcript_106971:1704-2378(+)